MELGRNDAFVLIDHTDTKAMALAAVTCRVSNGGQRCNASKRFIVLEEHYDVFVETLGKHMEALTLGDPMEATTDLPPMSSLRLLNDIHSQVTASIAE